MLKGKTVVLGVTGSIAAYKIAYLASALKKCEAETYVVMTENACRFISPLTFDTLTGHRTFTDVFDRDNEFGIPHIELARRADVLLIAPASADIIGKAAGGIADDMLTSLIAASTCPVIFSPAMNVHMFENRVLQDNLSKLKNFGYSVIEPANGYLACGDYGPGKMPEPDVLLDYLEYTVGHEKDLEGKKVLVTAGATKEAIDPVRYITNHSTGKMGAEIAKAAAMRGAEVTLVFGSMSVPLPPFVHTVHADSAAEMADAVKNAAPESDIVIMAAAVADYRPEKAAPEKIKKGGGELNLSLTRTEDILQYLGEHKRKGQFLCGFAMETENLVENARAKLKHKHADMIVANSLREEGAGFGTDTNIVTLISGNGEEKLPLLSKTDTAYRILDSIVKMQQEQ